METKKFMLTDKSEIDTQIPLELVTKIETALNNLHPSNLQATPFLFTSSDYDLYTGVMEKTEDDKWRLSYEITIKKR